MNTLMKFKDPQPNHRRMDDMEKHVPFNPAWFEPGADGGSPLALEIRKKWSTANIPEAISAAFRAIIAQDAAQEPPALQVGDVVRLEACPEREGHPNIHLFVGRVDAIEKMADTWDIQAPCAWFTIPNSTTGEGIWWPVSALTLVRRAVEPAPVDADERDHEPCMVCGHAVCYVDIDDPHMECENCCAKYSTAAQSVATETQYKHEVEAKDAEIARLTAERDAMFNRLESRTLDRNVYALRCTDKDEEIARLTSELHDRNDEIVGLRAEVERLNDVVIKMQRPAGPHGSEDDVDRDRLRILNNDLEATCAHLQAERDAARAEVERLKNECSDQQRYVLDLESAIARKETRIKVLEVANDSLTQYSSNLTAERDALRARIDAGVPVSGGDYGGKIVWGPIRYEADTHTALLIDAHPIAEADERKGKADRGKK